MNENKLKKRLVFLVVTVVLLVASLAVTSFALADSVVAIRNNRFTMNPGVTFEVNKGDPVVDVTDIIYEPGGRYQSKIPIANNATFDVWYRVYFTDVEGGLKDDITVTVKEENGKILCQGLMYELDSDSVSVSTLAAGEEKTLYIEFYFSSDAGNDAQGQEVSFNITANATQKQNNAQKDFGD